MPKATEPRSTATVEPHPAIVKAPTTAQAVATLPEAHAPGIVFGMPAAVYHDDPSLGASDLKRLLRSPADFWWHSKLNPNREPTPDSPSKPTARPGFLPDGPSLLLSVNGS